MSRVILASASPRRRELLGKAGVVFEVKPGSGDEIITKEKPWEIVEELSAAKAFQGAELQKNAEEGTVIIGADTVVAYEDRILGKPKDEQDAIETLEMLQGKTHQVYTGVTLLVRKGENFVPHTFHECTDVTFLPVSREVIEDYVRTGEPMDKAGSYGIQGTWGVHVAGFKGDYENVVGLPVQRLLREAEKIGIELGGQK